MKINPSKCFFIDNKLLFLGNLITPQGIEPDPEKLSAMLQFPAPTDQKKTALRFRIIPFLQKVYSKIKPHGSNT